MNFVRITLCLLVVIGAYFQVSEQITSAFSSSNKIVVDGLLNIWASIAMLLMCSYLTIYTIKDAFSLSLPTGEAKRVLLVLGLVIAPLFAVTTYTKSQSNVASYVECKRERKLSSRYSSRTYAISQEVCESLEVK